MAGDDEWELDIMWHGLLLAGNATANFWSSWSMQVLIVGSLVVQFALAISAGFRWRGVGWVRKYIIWLLYVGGDFLATTALSSLTVSRASGVHQLVALWAPFLLMHLGGPDNISAYSLEDNELSNRNMMQLILRVVGAAYVAYKSISGSRKSVVAAWLMLFVVGVLKYLEKALALRRANLGNMRKSVAYKSFFGSQKLAEEAFDDPDQLQGDEKLLLIAHNLFHICMRAMVDSSIMLDKQESDVADWEGLIKIEWEDTCKVMEMELSLVYDILYSKAAVIHTWHGYCIRVLSPIFTLIALVLFELSNEGGCSRADVKITRTLLVCTVFMETASLLRALGSSCTVAILYRKQRRGWLSHAILCNRRWHRLRRGLVSLRRFVRAERCREWSGGSIGQHNMLRLCTRYTKDRRCSLAKKMVEWCKDEHYYWTQRNGHPVKEVFEAIFKILRVWDTQGSEHSGRINETNRQNDGRSKSKDSRAVVNTLGLLKAERGWRALNGMGEKYSKALGRYIREEIHEQILIWHIATDVYLYESKQAEEEDAKVEAIKVLSNYMMFLLVERPYMLPGLALRKLYELTRDDLTEAWKQCATASNRAHQHDDRQKDLASILHKKQGEKFFKGKGLVLATELADELLNLKGKKGINFVFDVWVEIILYASHRCSRESHAKQLSTVSSGAELATVVWLLAEHAGLFPVNKKDEKKPKKTVRPSRWSESSEGGRCRV